MDRLERYLDQVCRGIAGPRALRQHVRRELAEHLRDAVAGHRAAGLSEDEALDRALEDFGRPEEVRSGLEEAHGQRLMAVVIDKALDWKEKTMRAKWLWLTWAHVALIGLVAVQVFTLTATEVLITPKVKKILADAGVGAQSDPFVAWAISFQSLMRGVFAEQATWWLLGSVALIALFEWRVRTENKSLVRLSAWGTVALVLGVLTMLTAAATTIPVLLAAPALMAHAR